ncbi:MAG: YfhO family protein [Chloroflexia bacterium]
MNLNSKLKTQNSKFLVPLLLLVLAFLFKLPGLPPWGVPLTNEQLLVYPPWQADYPGVSTLAQGGDPLLQQFPWRHWAQDELAAGRFPLWASGPLGGAPLFSYYQTAALYPLNLLWSLVPLGAGAGIIQALKLWLAGLGMWLFLRALGLRPSASLLGALGLMFCATLVIWLPWGHTNVFLLVPWLAWCVYAWCVQGKKGALAGFAVLLACAVLGGQPENLFIALVTTGIWALALILGSAPRRWLTQLGGLALAGVVGIAIGGIQLLPFNEALGLSEIANDPGRGQSWRVRMGANMMLDWLLPRWWGQVYDGVLGGPTSFYEGNGYLGLPALLGVVFAGVAAVRKQLILRLALPWLAIGLFAWVVIYDDTVGMFVRRLPFFDHSVNLRWLFVVGFAALTLGAFGWDWFARWADGKLRITNYELREKTVDGRRWTEEERLSTVYRPPSTVILLCGTSLLAVGVTIIVLHLAGLFQQPDLGAPAAGWYSPTGSYRWYWFLWVAGVVLGMAGAVLLWVSGWLGKRTVPIMGLVISALLIADLWMLLFTFNPSSALDRYYPTTSFISQAQALVPPTERVVLEGVVMPANTGLVYGIRDWRYQDPMIGARSRQAARLLAPDYDKVGWMAYSMFFPQVKMEVAPAFGIRYVIYPRETNPDFWEPFPGRPAFKRLAFTDGLGLWEVEGVPGFTYLSDNVEAVPGEAEAANWIQGMTWEKIRAYPAVVEASASSISGITRDPAGTSPGNVAVTTYIPGHIVLQTDADRPALLVVAESYYPGWHAAMDNQPVEILRTNYISQGIVVPAGKHTIEMKYEPDSFRDGMLLSIAGILGLVGLLAWWRWGPRRTKDVRSD